MQPAGDTDAPGVRSGFAEYGYVVLRQWLPAPVQARVQEAVAAADTANGWEKEADGAGDYCRGPANRYAYGQPITDRLLEFLALPIGRAIGLALLPTYSYLRVYGPGGRLVAHRDRPSCEISMTTPLAFPGQAVWPIWVRDRAGCDHAIELRPGDLLLYRGCELMHWREPLASGEQWHLFLHYVAAGGPRADWKYDKRPALGLPAHTRAV